MEHENNGDTNCKTVCSERYPRGLEEFEIGGCAETIQNTALLKSDRILRRVMET